MMSLRRLIILTLSIAFAFAAWAQRDSLSLMKGATAYYASAIANASSGTFAPYFIGSLNHGRIVQKNTALLDVGLQKAIDKRNRLSWGIGVEVIAGDASSVDYDHWKAAQKQWASHPESPSNLWLQQLYGELKYRGVHLSVGLKEHQSPILNTELSSGDVVQSGNSRPIPEVRLGFIDFQNIPFTDGWVQIGGEIAYGKYLDNEYLKDHYNYYSYHIVLSSLYNYKRCYFRTKPSERFSVTVGMQAAGSFGGDFYKYNGGVLKERRKYSESLKTFFNMFLPIGENGEDYYEGSSLGSWDLKMRYRISDHHLVAAYFQGLWEDGSGIGRMNKLDGIWGLEYESAMRQFVSGAVIEYIDFRDQSGPIHWAPQTQPGVSIPTQATGYDNYYNNHYYNSYAYFGLSMGSPFLLSPIYNLDGYPAFACTRSNGFHAGMSGYLYSVLKYRALFSYQRGMGDYKMPYYNVRTCTAVMLELNWDASHILNGLSMKCQAAYDGGSLRGENVGAAVTITYSGEL